MMTARLFLIGAGLHVSATVAAQTPPAAPAAPPLSTLKIGTRVGLPEKSGYDDGGRRDPFVSLVVERPVSVSTSGDSLEARAKGLAGVAIVDASVKGIITSGDKFLAIIAGPNGASYLAHANDRLHDGSIRRIDRDAVVFLARVSDVSGKVVAREVRKGIRAAAGDSR